MMTLAQAVQLLPGAQLVGDAALRFERVHTDTRSLRAGDLFVALKGERFDAHDFLAQAAASGAVAALAEHAAGASVNIDLADLRGYHLLEGCGHWTQQERPQAVNDLILSWLEHLDRA